MSSTLELQEKVTRTLYECIQAAAQRAAASQADLHRTVFALREEIRATENALREEIRRIKSAMFKRFLALWLATVLLFAGLLFAVLYFRPAL
ncbi:MAG: hypothetical protein ACUVXB_04905 [Bryobacteraceae bacterium]